MIDSAPEERAVSAGRPRRTAKRWALVLTVLLLLLIVYWVRLAIDSRDSLQRGDAARSRGDIPSAVIHFRHALQSHVPLGGAGSDALDRLADIGEEAFAAGEVGDALFALRSARLGVLSLRHLVIPFEERLKGIHRRIEVMSAAQTDTSSLESNRGRARVLDGYRDRFVPSGLGLLFGLGFLGWLGSLFLIVRSGFSTDGRPRPTLRWLGPLSVLLLLLWIVVLRSA